MTQHAAGPFEVKMLEAPLTDEHAPPVLGRRSLDKSYKGDLKATGRGEMLSAMGAVSGSAGYVAIEFVSGTLMGKKGTFVLQHTGVMNRGAKLLQISVVPDSGTDELLGLSGSMDIEIKPGGAHFYTLDFTLPSAD